MQQKIKKAKEIGANCEFITETNVLVFCHCDKYPTKTIGGGKICFCSWLKRFQFMVDSFRCFGPETAYHGGWPWWRNTA